MINDVEIINEKEIPFFNNVKIVYERFELLPNNSLNIPVVFAKRIIKNSDDKTYSYAVFVDSKDYYYYLDRIINSTLMEYNENAKIINSIALEEAYHQKYGKDLQMKVIKSLKNSQELLENDNNIWQTLGYYSEKEFNKKLIR